MMKTKSLKYKGIVLYMGEEMSEANRSSAHCQLSYRRVVSQTNSQTRRWTVFDLAILSVQLPVLPSPFHAVYFF